MEEFCPCSNALIGKSSFSFAPVNFCQHQWLEMEMPELTAATAVLMLTVLYFKAIYFWGVFCRQTTNALWERNLWVPVSRDGQQNIWFCPVKPNTG